MGRLDGKIALITGAARGQGECEARLFAAEGAKVLLTDVLDEGAAVAESIGAAAAYAHLDVTSAADWQSAVALCSERFGTPNVLVNNAGIMLPGTLLECDEATFRKTLDINLTGAFLGIQTVAKAMIDGGGGGSIVNISSVAALVARPGYTAYGTSKWGLRGLTKYAAMELGHHGIRVNSIHPGAVATPMTLPDLSPAAVAERNSLLAHLPIPRWAQPEEIARLALFLASEESSFSTGSEFVADGGRSAGSA
jgi:3alpha(or 20beta)-hydroxysteroid dehydrogenase